MSRINPSSQQAQPEAGDLALHAGVGGTQAQASSDGQRIADSILALVGTLRGDRRVSSYTFTDGRVVVCIDSLYCAICPTCREVIGLADSVSEAALSFCRVCDEVNTARVRGRHVLSRLLALRHGLSIAPDGTVAATGNSSHLTEGV